MKHENKQHMCTQLSLLSSVGWEMSSSLQAVEWRPSASDRGDGVCMLL